MADHLHYLFSTLAQTFAALGAFVFMAAQNRIEWLDNKITASKMALLFKINAGTQNIEFYMATRKASQVINDGLAKTDTGVQEMAKELNDLVDQIQALRKAIQHHVVWSFGIIGFGIIGLVAVPLLADCNAASWVALVGGAAVALLGACQVGRFIYESLKVSLKEKL